ncbi:MAG: hypothetical protein ACK4UU_07810, partial [Fimbriimonadales bacterium]
MPATQRFWIWGVIGAFAIAVGWQLYTEQQNRVPALPTLLHMAADAAEQSSPLNRCALLERAVHHWLELGRTEEARCLMPALINAAHDRHCRCEERERHWLKIAALWLALDNLDEAKRAAEHALQANTVFLLDPDALTPFFQALLQRVSPEEAQRWVETLSPATPSLRTEYREMLLRALGRAAAAQGALDFAERILRATASSPQDLAELAYWFRQHGQHARADALTREAIRRFETHPEALGALNLARTLQRMGRATETEQ